MTSISKSVWLPEGVSFQTRNLVKQGKWAVPSGTAVQPPEGGCEEERKGGGVRIQPEIKDRKEGVALIGSYGEGGRVWKGGKVSRKKGGEK